MDVLFSMIELSYFEIIVATLFLLLISGCFGYVIGYVSAERKGRKHWDDYIDSLSKPTVKQDQFTGIDEDIVYEG